MEINSVSDFENFYQENLSGAFPAGVHLLYRGHGKVSYLNLPTISRYGLSDQDILLFDKAILEKIKAAIDKNGFIGGVKFHPGFGTPGHFNDWLILTQARHLEMPSRLQDWSMVWQVALYFAVNDTALHNEPGHVWILPCPMDFTSSNFPQFDEGLAQRFLHLGAGDEDRDVLDSIDPFNIDKTMLVHYAHSAPDWLLQIGELRRGAQGGKFVVSRNNLINYPLDKQFIGQLMSRIVIPANAKSAILEELMKHHIAEKNIMPPIPSDTKEILEEIKQMALAEVKAQAAR